MPRPAHISWRANGLLYGWPGVWVALSTVVKPNAMINSAQMSSGQSKCAMSRRSILSISPVLPIPLELEVLLQHVVDDRGRDGAAAALGVLHQAGHGDLRRVDRGIGDEP